MSYIEKFFKHFWMVCKHKYWVFYFACKCGIPVRGFFHDFSKFHPTEFFESVKYYTGTKSPIVSCKEDKGYSLAWQHHKGHNPHHYEYWVDNLDNGGTPLIIPFKYCVEMVCDWLAAGKSYQGKDFNYDAEYSWWQIKRKEVQHSMHPAIIKFFDRLFYNLKETGDCLLNKNQLKIYYRIALSNEDTTYVDNSEYEWGHNVPSYTGNDEDLYLYHHLKD